MLSPAVHNTETERNTHRRIIIPLKTAIAQGCSHTNFLQFEYIPQMELESTEVLSPRLVIAVLFPPCGI